MSGSVCSLLPLRRSPLSERVGPASIYTPIVFHQCCYTIRVSVIFPAESACSSSQLRPAVPPMLSHHFSVITPLFTSPAALPVCLCALSGTSSRRPPVESTEGLGQEPAGPDSEPLGQNGGAGPRSGG